MDTCGGQKKVLVPLELDFTQAAVVAQCGCRDQASDPLGEQHALLCAVLPPAQAFPAKLPVSLSKPALSPVPSSLPISLLVALRIFS